jgi:hypothetical protein
MFAIAAGVGLFAGLLAGLLCGRNRGRWCRGCGRTLDCIVCQRPDLPQPAGRGYRDR